MPKPNDERVQAMLAMRNEGHTLRAIAAEFGITRQCVHQTLQIHVGPEKLARTVPKAKLRKDHSSKPFRLTFEDGSQGVFAKVVKTQKELGIRTNGISRLLNEKIKPPIISHKLNAKIIGAVYLDQQ